MYTHAAAQLPEFTPGRARHGQPARLAGRLAATKYARTHRRGVGSLRMLTVRACSCAAVLIAIAPVPLPAGQKAVISRTAVFLCVFVVVHAIGNLTATCGQSAFNDCAFVS